MRYRILVLALTMLAVACGGTDSTTSAAPEGTAATAAPGTTQGSSPTTAGSDTTSATPAPEGPPAPDFTTTLSDGSEFTLAAHGKPVYLVFWAEW